MLFAGIDVGQSSTSAVVGDETGAVLGYGSAGPADEINVDATSTRLRDALALALTTAIFDAKLPSDAHFERIVAGVSGYEGRVYGAQPILPSANIELVHDGVIAHVGALAGENGVVVIAGTGSVAIAHGERGLNFQEGGWGYLFGDEGSAFWIARSVMQAAIAHQPCAAEEALLRFFKYENEYDDLRDLARAFYVNKISRSDFAAFARVCLEAGRTGIGCACLIDPPRAAAHELAKLAARAARHTPDAKRISFVGGLMSDEWFRYTVERETRDLLPNHTVVAPQHEPVMGALWLARHAR